VPVKGAPAAAARLHRAKAAPHLEPANAAAAAAPVDDAGQVVTPLLRLTEGCLLCEAKTFSDHTQDCFNPDRCATLTSAQTQKKNIYGKKNAHVVREGYLDRAAALFDTPPLNKLHGVTVPLCGNAAGGESKGTCHTSFDTFQVTLLPEELCLHDTALAEKLRLSKQKTRVAAGSHRFAVIWAPQFGPRSGYVDVADIVAPSNRLLLLRFLAFVHHHRLLDDADWLPNAARTWVTAQGKWKVPSYGQRKPSELDRVVATVSGHSEAVAKLTRQVAVLQWLSLCLFFCCLRFFFFSARASDLQIATVHHLG
jgi:hypothetical protein